MKSLVTSWRTDKSLPFHTNDAPWRKKKLLVVILRDETTNRSPQQQQQVTTTRIQYYCNKSTNSFVVLVMTIAAVTADNNDCAYYNTPCLVSEVFAGNILRLLSEGSKIYIDILII